MHEYAKIGAKTDLNSYSKIFHLKNAKKFSPPLRNSGIGMAIDLISGIRL